MAPPDGSERWGVRAARSLVFDTEITEEDEITEKKARPRAPGRIPPAAKPQRPKPPAPGTRARPSRFSVISSSSETSVLNRRLRRCHAAGIERSTEAAQASSDRRVSGEAGVAASPPRRQGRPHLPCWIRSIAPDGCSVRASACVGGTPRPTKRTGSRYATLTAPYAMVVRAIAAVAVQPRSHRPAGRRSCLWKLADHYGKTSRLINPHSLLSGWRR